MLEVVEAKKDSASKVQIYADPASVEAFRALYESLGMTQREAGGRLFRWFCEQQEVVQRHILSPLPPSIAPDVARLILERMAEPDPAMKIGPEKTPSSGSTTGKRAASSKLPKRGG